MTKKLKIILATIAILIISGIGGLAFRVDLMNLFDSFFTDSQSKEAESIFDSIFIFSEGKEAQSIFESITEISDAPIAETHIYFKNRLDPFFFSAFRTNKDFIEELISKYELEEESIESSNCQILLNANFGRSWWNPKNFTVDKCYSGGTEEEKFYLIYHPSSGKTFFHIQR